MLVDTVFNFIQLFLTLPRAGLVPRTKRTRTMIKRGVRARPILKASSDKPVTVPEYSRRNNNNTCYPIFFPNDTTKIKPAENNSRLNCSRAGRRWGFNMRFWTLTLLTGCVGLNHNARACMFWFRTMYLSQATIANSRVYFSRGVRFYYLIFFFPWNRVSVSTTPNETVFGFTLLVN